MKTLYEIKKDALIIPPSSVWEDLFQKVLNLLEEFGMKDKAEEFNQQKFKYCNFEDSTRFEAEYITALIKHALDTPAREQPLWNDIFKITMGNKGALSYHSSDSEKTVIEWKFELKEKREQLRDTRGDWVYCHGIEVENFLCDSNTKFNLLLKISKLFPLEEIK